MDKQATARLRLELDNAQSVLAEFRAIRQELEGLRAAAGGGSPGAGGGVATVGGPGAPMQVAQPGVNVGSLSMAGSLAGSAGMATWINGRLSPLAVDPIANRYVDTSTGSYLTGHRPMGGGDPADAAAGLDPKAAGMTVAKALAGLDLGWRSLALATSYAGGAAQAAATGGVFYGESLAPGAMSIGAGLGAAGIVALAGGPPGWVLAAGMGAMTVVGGMADAALGPGIQQNIGIKELNRLAGTKFQSEEWYQRIGREMRGWFGGSEPSPLPTPSIDALQAEVMAGRPVSQGTVNALDRVLGNRDQVGRVYASVMRGAMGAAAQRSGRFGDILDGGPESLADMRDALRFLADDDPWGASFAFGQLGMRREQRRSQELAMHREELASRGMGIEADVGLASAHLGYAARYQGSAGMASHMSAVGSGLQARAANLRAEAATYSNPDKRRALLAQAEQAELEAKYGVQESYFGVKQSEIAAASGLAAGSANRALQRALYAGTSAEALPFGTIASAASTAASELEAYRRERAAKGMLSPAEDMMLRNQIEQQRFEASVNVPRMAERAVWSERGAAVELAAANRLAGAAGSLTFGSASEQARSGEFELTAIRERIRLRESELATAKMLTAEERMQREEAVSRLRVLEQSTAAAASMARVSATREGAMLGMAEASTLANISLLRGAGGAQGTEALLGLADAAGGRVRAQEEAINSLIADGFSPDSREVRSARAELLSLQLAEEQTQRASAVAPVSGRTRAQMSSLQTMQAFFAAGYGGSVGAMRGNLQNQQALLSGMLNEQDSHRRKLMAAGRWTDAMEADHAERQNALQMQALQLQIQADEGFTGRLISEAFNMPTTGRLPLAKFNRMRSAIFAGIANRAFGGTQEQTQGYLDTFPRIGAFGSGNPGAFTDRAMGGAEQRTQIDLNLSIVDGNGREVRLNSAQIHNHNTAASVSVNQSEQRTAAG